MDSRPITQIDISKVKGPYTLLGLFLLVTEALLSFWLFQATGVFERVICGFFMTLIFGAFLWVVVRLSQVRSGDVGKIIPQDLDAELTPAKDEATEDEIENPEPQMMGAPDGSYTINKPPDDWDVRELTLAELMAESLGVPKKEDVKEQQSGHISKDKDEKILLLKSRIEISVIPIPGRTLVEGRKAPTALETLISPQLAILPIARARPPLFVERSFTHNVSVFLGEVLSVGLVTLHDLTSGVIENTNRRYIAAELGQRLENVMVNGMESKRTNVNVTVIGIEGELKDHVLIMRYVFSPVVDDPAFESNLKTLQALVSSFRPLKVINANQVREQYRNTANENFTERMTEKGDEMFWGEFIILLFRLKELDLNIPEHRIKALRMVKPFEILAKEVKVEEEFLDELWQSVHQAESGNAIDFKEYLTYLKDEVSDELLPLLASGKGEKDKKQNNKKDTVDT